MNKQEYIQKQIKEIKEIWFKDHIAVYESFGEGESKIERLKWSKPGDSNFYIHYVTSGGCLMVYGDLGEQTYNFYRQISILGFTEEKQWPYYCSKAHDIDGYCDLDEWVPKHAKEWIEEYAEGNGEKLPEDWTDYLDEIPEYKLVEYICDETADSEFAYGCYKAGKSINMRALSHFIGLVMANEQLKNSLTTT